jgi:hypothetical protein
LDLASRRPKSSCKSPAKVLPQAGPSLPALLRRPSRWISLAVGRSPHASHRPKSSRKPAPPSPLCFVGPPVGAHAGPSLPYLLRRWSRFLASTPAPIAGARRGRRPKSSRRLAPPSPLCSVDGAVTSVCRGRLLLQACAESTPLPQARRSHAEVPPTRRTEHMRCPLLVF